MTTLQVTVTKISEAGLAVKLADGTEGSVPSDEIFTDPTKPVFLSDLAYLHAVSVSVGQKIPVLPLRQRPGHYSRRAAVLGAVAAAKNGEQVCATISEIQPNEIYAIADQGYVVLLPLGETVSVSAAEVRKSATRAQSRGRSI